MRSTKLLRYKLVSYLDQEVECFMIHGEWLEITLHDVYFLKGLPILGVIDDTTPKLPRGVSMDDLCDRHRYASAYVHTSYIPLYELESLET